MPYDELFTAVRYNKFNETRKANKFTVIFLWYHVSYCQKNPCSNCQFIIDFKDFF